MTVRHKKKKEKICKTIINRKVRRTRTDIDSGRHRTCLTYSAPQHAPPKSIYLLSVGFFFPLNAHPLKYPIFNQS